MDRGLWGDYYIEKGWGHSQALRTMRSLFVTRIQVSCYGKMRSGCLNAEKSLVGSRDKVVLSTSNNNDFISTSNKTPQSGDFDPFEQWDTIGCFSAMIFATRKWSENMWINNVWIKHGLDRAIPVEESRIESYKPYLRIVVLRRTSVRFWELLSCSSFLDLSVLERYYLPPQWFVRGPNSSPEVVRGY